MNIVLVSGAQRTGTTILEETLDSHPTMKITHELDLTHVLRCINSSLFHPRHTHRKVLDFSGDYAPIVAGLYQGSTTKPLTHVGDKFPYYTRCYPLLQHWFPDAKHLVCSRHPYEVMNSMIARTMRADVGLDRGWDAGLRLTTMCERWNAAQTAMRRLQATNAKNVLRVEYDALTSETENEFRRIAGFLGTSDHFDISPIHTNKKDLRHLDDAMKRTIRIRCGDIAREAGYKL